MMDRDPKALRAIMLSEESLGSYAGVKAFQTSDLKLCEIKLDLGNKVF